MIKNNKIKFADVLLILLFVATIIYFSINFFVKNKNTVKQVIIESGKNIWYYQLDKDKIIEVKGILGESTIKIEDGFVLPPVSHIDHCDLGHTNIIAVINQRLRFGPEGLAH